MPTSEKIPQKPTRILASVVSLALLGIGTILSPPGQDQIIPLITLVLIIAVIEILPLDLFGHRYSLIHLVLLPSGLIYGIGISVWACFIGFVAAAAFQAISPRRTFSTSHDKESGLWAGLFNFSFNATLLLLTLLIFGMTSGVASQNILPNQWWSLIFGAGVFFGISHGFIYWSAIRLFNSNETQKGNWDYLALISIEILPIFFSFTSLLIYPIVGDGALIILGVSTFAISLLIFYLSAPWKNLARRMEELSTLEEISKVLSADIDLERLLSSIQFQVTDLLDVDNFYVALLDPVDQQIWYPLAVKHGKRQTWKRRPLMDRLTDRVIQKSSPILLANNAREKLSEIGLPAGEDAPFAWIGVPLVTSEQTIGCLALFSMSPGTEFTQDDLNLLSILSGQTSVAIEIALHNALLSSDITIGRDRLTTILNSVQDGLLLIDPDGKITLLNEAVSELTGMPQSEFLGQKISDLPESTSEAIGFSATEADLLQDKFRRDPKQLPGKYTYKLDKPSPELFIERSIIQVQHNSHKLSGWIITLRDVTDEYQLKQAQDLISETLVHDLRSPLSSTISALDVINDAYKSGDPAGVLEPSIQIAQRSSRRMLGMVESILEINRMESGTIDLSLDQINLNDLLKECIAEFYTLSKDYDVTIKFKPAEHALNITMDEDKIHRVINNLIDNALKFSPPGEEIIVSIQLPDPDFIEIRVLDRGPGIPGEHIKSIFDRFFQIPDRASRKRGSGLGLTYCRLAVEAHAGKIWVENRSGGGSTFVVSLPIGNPEGSEP